MGYVGDARSMGPLWPPHSCARRARFPWRDWCWETAQVKEQALMVASAPLLLNSRSYGVTAATES